MEKYKVIIGIDPDVDKSGVGVVYPDGRLETKSLTFGQMVSYLQQVREHYNAIVFVEAGWKNTKSTWHARPGDTKNVCAKKGLAVGRNQQVGHDIVSIAQVYKLDVREVAPLRKCWAGSDGKITADELEYVVGKELGRTNQEARDALLLAWVCAERPVRVKPR